MVDAAKPHSFAQDNVIVVGASTCLSHVLIILLYFWFALNTSGQHHSWAVFQNSDMVMASLWSLAVTTIVSFLSFTASRFIRQVAPSWLAISIGSTFLFIFSVYLFGYWVEVTTYNADDPFSRKPPLFESVVASAFCISVFVSAVSVAIVFGSYASWLRRNKGTEIHIASR